MKREISILASRTVVRKRDQATIRCQLGVRETIGLDMHQYNHWLPLLVMTGNTHSSSGAWHRAHSLECMHAGFPK